MGFRLSVVGCRLSVFGVDGDRLVVGIGHAFLGLANWRLRDESRAMWAGGAGRVGS